MPAKHEKDIKNWQSFLKAFFVQNFEKFEFMARTKEKLWKSNEIDCYEIR